MILVDTFLCSQNAATVCLESCAKTSADIVQIYHSVTTLTGLAKRGANQDTNRNSAISVIKGTRRQDLSLKF